MPDRVLEASLVVEEKIAGLLHPGTELGAEYEVIDVAGKVLMPGVIDSHVHMGSLPSELPGGLEMRVPVRRLGGNHDDYRYAAQRAAGGG